MKADETEIQDASLDIAIIGFAGRFPGAANADEFWKNLCSGVESIAFFSDEELKAAGVDDAVLSDPNYVKAAPALKDFDKFDAQLFGYSPREARTMDPQHRFFLECAWEALEHAGYESSKYDGSIGVYAGSAMNTYILFSGLLPQFNKEYLLTLIGNDKDYLATRVSYKLDLTGPSVTVQTACSTSLVATHLACQSLLNGECEMALAGGVSVRVPHKTGYFYQPGSVFSPDGHCRTFDSKARGTIFGSGAGVVALKRLADALADRDTIHAVIKGSAINNDGSSKIEFTAPSMVSQSEAVAEALAHAGINAETISYVEAHGTGTLLGDPIEIAALTKAFRAFTQKKQFCAIGTAKTNIGHMDAAAGVAGLIKTTMSLERKQIPPILHFEKPNPEIDFENSPFYVNTTLSNWEASQSPRRAGVNSLGMGGTNAFVILEEAPAMANSSASRPFQLLLLSAKTTAALEAATARLAQHLSESPQANLADVSYTLKVGRRDLEHRRMLVCKDQAEAIDLLTTEDAARIVASVQKPVARQIAFMFTGQGSQYANMGRGLYETETVFRDHLDQCLKILKRSLSIDLRDIIFPSQEYFETASSKLNQTSITQPALFAIEYSLARLWQSWGIEPEMMIGHSVGEYVAACLAGVFSLDDALELVAARGKMMQALPAGSMLAVPISEQDIEPLLSDKLCLAAVNGASLCVVSGETVAIENLEKLLSERGLKSRRLRTSHAFHSEMMEPILEPFSRLVEQINLKAPKIPFVSNVTGKWVAPDQALSPEYWARQIRQTVRFADGLSELLEEPARALLEVGPGQTLCSLAAIHPGKRPSQVALSSLPDAKRRTTDPEFMLGALGRLWLAGVRIDWSGFYSNERRRRIPLPTYSFQRQRYWADPVAEGESKHAPPVHDAKQTSVGETITGERETDSAGEPIEGFPPLSREQIEELVTGIFQEVLGITEAGRNDDFFELGGTSILVTQILSRLNETFRVDLSALNILESPTIAGLSDCIDAVQSAHLEPPLVVT
jgi:acyl transferase domain-containing protein